MLIAYLGNFSPPHSTENEVRRALEILDHDVMPIQEGTPATEVFDLANERGRPAVFLWTRTGDLAAKSGPYEAQVGMLERFRGAGIPSVGYHLDRWWGLDRQGQIADEAFFCCDLMCTADGGHDAEWAQAGVDHRWFPPAISELEAVPGRPRGTLAAPVAFVGSWRVHLDDDGHQVGYHPEWEHRRLLVEWLRRNWGERGLRLWPRGHAIRGRALADVYASTDVVVGDSCLVDGGARYFSDRIPETLGRGGFLLHPWVEGVTDGSLFTSGEHLATWRLGAWDELGALIDRYLGDAAAREKIAVAGREHVLAHHTYTARMRQLLAMLADDGLL